MIKPTITGKMPTLEVQGADKLWSLKSRLEVSLEHITDVYLDSEVAKTWYHGLKAPGTSIPHVITAGTFYRDGARTFWDIHHPEKAVVISFSDDDYNQLVIEVDDPEGFVSQLQDALVRR